MPQATNTPRTFRRNDLGAQSHQRPDILKQGNRLTTTDPLPGAAHSQLVHTRLRPRSHSKLVSRRIAATSALERNPEHVQRPLRSQSMKSSVNRAKWINYAAKITQSPTKQKNT